MALPGLRRAPLLARITAALALIGWIPLPAIMAVDDLAYQVALSGETAQNVALWTRFNGDPVMLIYLIWYAAGHLVSTLLIAYLLGKLRFIPRWTAWAFALTVPVTMAFFIVQALPVRYVLLALLCVGLALGAWPAAYATLKQKPDA